MKWNNFQVETKVDSIHSTTGAIKTLLSFVDLVGEQQRKMEWDENDEKMERKLWLQGKSMVIVVRVHIIT